MVIDSFCHAGFLLDPKCDVRLFTRLIIALLSSGVKKTKKNQGDGKKF